MTETNDVVTSNNDENRAESASRIVPRLNTGELKEVEQRTRASATVLHETIRGEGEQEQAE